MFTCPGMDEQGNGMPRRERRSSFEGIEDLLNEIEAVLQERAIESGAEPGGVQFAVGDIFLQGLKLLYASLFAECEHVVAPAETINANVNQCVVQVTADLLNQFFEGHKVECHLQSMGGRRWILALVKGDRVDGEVIASAVGELPRELRATVKRLQP